MKDPSRDYISAGVLLVTSEFEGFCFSLLEGQAYGIPVVMYELPYLPTVKGSKGIRAVRQGEIEEAAKNIIEILCDDALREELAREAKAQARRLLQQDVRGQWEKIFKDFEKEIPFNGTEDNWIDVFLEHNEEGIKQEVALVKQELRYRIGDCIVKIPRKIKHLIKR